MADFSLALGAGCRLRAAPQPGGLHGRQERPDGRRGDEFAADVQTAQEAFSCAAAPGLRCGPGVCIPVG